MFNYECIYILWFTGWHPSQKLWQFEFALSFLVQFLACRYIMDLNRTSESKVMAVWIFSRISCSISSMSIYYKPWSYIQVRSYGSLKFPGPSLLYFERLDMLQASIGLLKSILMVVRICIALGLNWTSQSKVIVIWIYHRIPCSISSISIYYGLESDIQIKSYGRLNLPRAFVFSFEHLEILGASIIHSSQK